MLPNGLFFLSIVLFSCRNDLRNCCPKPHPTKLKDFSQAWVCSVEGESFVSLLLFSDIWRIQEAVVRRRKQAELNKISCCSFQCYCQIFGRLPNPFLSHLEWRNCIYITKYYFRGVHIYPVRLLQLLFLPHFFFFSWIIHSIHHTMCKNFGDCLSTSHFLHQK